MKGYDNLMTSLKDEGGRKKVFKNKPINLTDKQKDLLNEHLKSIKHNSYNWMAVTDVEANNIIRGRNTVVDCVLVVLRMGKPGMSHYFTIDEFNAVIGK